MYASGLRKLFCRGYKRDTRERLIYAKLIVVFTPKLEFPLNFEVIHGSRTFKLTKS